MTGSFATESERILRIEVNGGVWIKPGAAIAYRGAISFERLATAAAHSLRQAAMREAAPLVRAAGNGVLYCAHRGAHVRIVRLEDATMVVSAPELLAFESSLACEMSLLGHGLGIAAGGLVVASLRGSGALALLTHGEPLTLRVTPGNPVCTDPHATIAWSGQLSPTLKTDLGWRSAIAHGGQEPIQMHFDGDGDVIVQPFEDASRFTFKENPVGALTKLLAE
jgi:uncharacterized protein (AIM24 family)